MLANFIQDGAYRLQMQFERGTFTDFYRPATQEVLAERNQWLSQDAEKYLAALPESYPLLSETLETALEAGVLSGGPVSDQPEALARFLGEHLEPDYLVMSATGLRLVAGCVCFPSSWALEEKVGHPIDEIHGVVPGLNAALGRQISGFLDRIKPGISWNRTNWGLSRSADRNQHPSRRLPRLDASATIDQVFFRVELQSLVALPKTKGILFGIAIRVFPLRALKDDSEACVRLVQALETMPEDMAIYKGVSTARTRVIELLRE